VNKPWQPYAQHILDAITKIKRIQLRGSIVEDDLLYDAALRNLQTLYQVSKFKTQVLLDQAIPVQQHFILIPELSFHKLLSLK